LNLDASKEKVAALTAPRNVVLVGASDRPGSWAARVWHNLNRYEFPGPIYLINPRRSEIWDQPCYPDFQALPQAPDHMVVLVPAAGVIDTLRRGAAAGARSATVFSAGFGEGFDTEAAVLGRELTAVIAQTGLGVSGPNCMGNVCAKSRLVTLTEDRPLAVQPGPVALVGQSGGMMIFTNQALQERGIWPEYLITSGNEAGLSIADYIAFFADQPELKVIIIYVEAISQLAKFKAACRMARAANKSIVAVKLGQSEGGRSAAMAHTGSLAGSVEAFDAIAGEVGVIRADTSTTRSRSRNCSCIPALRRVAGWAPSRSPAPIAACSWIRRSETGWNSPHSHRRRLNGSTPCSRSDRWSPIRSTAATGF